MMQQPTTNMMSDETLFSKPIESTFEKSSEMAATKYKIERTLKRTLCGSIKLATNAQKCPVAIKFSSRKQLTELNLSNCAENPQEEIRLMKKLRDSPLDGHQFVIQLLDTYTFQRGSDTIDCTVLEFADGGEFFEHVQTLAHQGGRMDVSSVRNAFAMIAKGVRFIHKNGIVHLDLSLENILLTKENVLKLCDFGLAREGRIFKLSTAPGKFPYMAPEVFAKKEFDGQKADVWSLGVILWCLLTSLALYELPSDSDARFQRLRNGKKGIKEIITAFQVHGIPEVVIDLLSGMLNVNPTQRLSIQEVLDHPWFSSDRRTITESKSSSVKTNNPTTTSEKIVDTHASEKIVNTHVSKSTTSTMHTTTTASNTTPTTSTIATIIEESPSKTSSPPHVSGRDKKIVSPPMDDSWSTYHRLYDQFEEKYGKLISAQENSASNSTTYHPQYMSSPYSPISHDMSSSYAPTSQDVQAGWKRKKMGYEEPGRRQSPPRFNLNE